MQALCLGLGFGPGRKRGGGEKGGVQGGGIKSKGKKERRSEARENLVILRTAASLMDSVCAECVLCGVWGGKRERERGEEVTGQQEKGCVYPICSLPLACGVGKTTGSRSDPAGQTGPGSGEE